MTGSTHLIRRAEARDMDAIHEIEEECFTAPWSRKNIEHELSVSYSWFLVAERSGEIAGYIIAWDVKGEIQLNHIAVRPRARRSGIGRMLVKALVDGLSAQGASRVLLEVRSRNEEALGFYRALGFVENGRRKNYYHDDDALLMEKVL
ncbi:MAG: ribosomal-protein-alanine N-acetyltransferase [Spirochaetes bacterium]|nr:MAG: ribosomal-protein-alanine N-acetyltransferase [Spirochaetota bacterium]